MKKRGLVIALVLCLTTSWVAAMGQTLTLPGTTERVSVSAAGDEGNAWSLYPSISADGRYVAFYSEADNLVPDDWNAEGDAFVYDRQMDTIERITDTGSGIPHLSADGRYVAFTSADGSLVPGDTNGLIDVFVYDRETGAMERVSVGSDGQEADGHSSNSFISADGNYVVFRSAATTFSPIPNGGWSQLFVHDRQAGLTEMVSVNSNGEAGVSFHSYPSISADGRYAGFSSSAPNLVENDTNDASDVFVRDRQQEITLRISVSAIGEEGNDDSTLPMISASGRYVVFSSWSDNLVDNDTNERPDAFVHDLLTGETELVSVSTSGEQAESSSSGTISADGRYVAFNSVASNLVISDTNETMDVFLRDRLLGITERLNVNSAGEEATGGYSSYGYISEDGRFTAFLSDATNLVAGDTNGFTDIFVRDRPLLSATLNYGRGAPGSYFTLSGTNFPLTNTAVISVNGYLLGSVPTDSSGTFTVLLSTAKADLGAYFVTAAVAPYEATVRFVLEADGELRPQEGEGPIFAVPAGIAHQLYFFPLIRR